MGLQFMVWFDLSGGSKIGWKWPFFFHERQISRSQRSRCILPPTAVVKWRVYVCEAAHELHTLWRVVILTADGCIMSDFHDCFLTFLSWLEREIVPKNLCLRHVNNLHFSEISKQVRWFKDFLVFIIPMKNKYFVVIIIPQKQWLLFCTYFASYHFQKVIRLIAAHQKKWSDPPENPKPGGITRPFSYPNPTIETRTISETRHLKPKGFPGFRISLQIPYILL